MPNPFAPANTPQPTGQQPAQPQQPSGNPFAQVQPKKKTDQQPAVSPQPAPEPAQLPDGAKGLDANGQPIFGDGLGGILKKWAYNFNKDVKPVDPTQWDALKARWGQAMQAPASGNTKEFLQGQ